MMRVALDTHALLGRPTGIGRYTASLLAALREIAPDDEFVGLDAGETPVMHTLNRLRWQQRALPQLARSQGIDLLHVTGFDAPLRPPCPVVLTVHDLIGWLFPQNMPPVSRLYWSRWLPWSLRAADALIADSECTRRDILRLYPRASERITVVPLAADARFVPQPIERVAALRAKLGLPTRALLYVGTLEPRKGLDTLVDAWALLAAQFPDVTLVIAGKPGWYTERLHAQVEQHGLAQRVCFTDYVADDDLPALYASAEAFVFPSRYEGFGLPPLEAMACGVPVVSSNSAALPEVLGNAGLLIPPDDAPALARALHLVLTQPTLRAELRARGYTQAERFSWARTARETLAVYRAVLEQRS